MHAILSVFPAYFAAGIALALGAGWIWAATTLVVTGGTCTIALGLLASRPRSGVQKADEADHDFSEQTDLKVRNFPRNRSSRQVV